MDGEPSESAEAAGKRPPSSSPRVVVITVTYNRAHVLARAIASVLSQDYPRLRAVVVDDGSTDDTPALLSQYEADARVDVVRHETNRGMLAARNTALASLDDGDDYFCYLDSDDTLAPGAITTMVNAISRFGERYSMVWAASQDADTGRSDGWNTLDSDELAFDDHIAGRIHGDYMQLVRCDLVDGLRHHPWAMTDEAVMWAQVLRKRPALIIPDVVQLTDRSGIDRMSHVRLDRARSESLMWSRVSTLRAIGADLKRAYPRRYATLLKDLARDAALAGDGRRARLASRQALRLDPSLEKALVACAALAPSWILRRCVQVVSLVRSQRAA